MKTHFADDATLARIAELERENADLRQQLAAAESRTVAYAKDALDAVVHWGAYASDYFAKKWDLQGEIKKWEIRALLKGNSNGQG
jgi:hypothetical protein